MAVILFWVEIFECLGEERSDGVSMTCQTNNYRCLVSLLLSLTSVRLEEQNTQLEKLQKQTTCLGTNQDPQWPCWLLLRLTELQSVRCRDCRGVTNTLSYTFTLLPTRRQSLDCLSMFWLTVSGLSVLSVILVSGQSVLSVLTWLLVQKRKMKQRHT